MDELWGDLRIEGYIGGKKVITRNFSGRGVDRKFSLLADDTALLADGAARHPRLGEQQVSLELSAAPPESA